MSELPENNQEKKRRKWPWVTLAVLLVATALIRLAITSDRLFERLSHELEVRVSERLAGDLRIGRMSGDLRSHLRIENLELREEDAGRAIMSLDTLYIRYSLFDLVFRRPLEIRQMDLLGLRVDVVQDDAGRWNLMEMLAMSDPDPDVRTDPADGVEEAVSPIPFVVRQLRLTAPRVRLEAKLALPGEMLYLRDVHLQTRFGMDSNRWFADIYRFDLLLEESRMDAPLEFSSQASWDGQRFTLEKLLFSSACSWVQFAGEFDWRTTSTNFSGTFDPLCGKEMQSWIEHYPLVEDLEVSLHLGGSFHELRAGFAAEAPGLNDFRLDTRWVLLDEPVLAGLNFSMEGLDLNRLTGMESPAFSAGRTTLDMEGVMPVMQWDRLRVDAKLEVAHIEVDDYHLDHLEASLQADRGKIKADLAMHKNEESIRLDLNADHWWSEEVNWFLTVAFDDLDPGFWGNLPNLEGRSAFRASLSGKGFAPGREPWVLEIEEARLKLDDLPELRLHSEMEFFTDRLASCIRLGMLDTRMQMNAEVWWGSEMPFVQGFDSPQYVLNLGFEEVDLSVIPGMNLPATRIGAKIEAEGKGLNPQKMFLSSTLLIGPSEINRQRFDEISLDLELREGIMQISDGKLESAPAQGRFSLTQNIMDFRDIGNRLDFDFEIRDLQGFANLAGADTLQAIGQFNGTLRPSPYGFTVLEADMRWHSIQWDSLKIGGIHGSMTAELDETISYRLNFELLQPEMGSYIIHDMMLASEGFMLDGVLDGRYELVGNVDEGSGFSTHALFRYEDTLRVQTTLLNLTDPVESYRLDHAFDVLMTADMVVMDTLRLVSDSGSEISMNLNKLPGMSWKGTVAAQQADLGKIQQIFQGQPFIEAQLTGYLHFELDETHLQLDAQLDFYEWVYESFSLDSIRLALHIGQQRFVSDLQVWNEDMEWLHSRFDLPFEPVNPGDKTPAFLNEPVSGFIRINPVNMLYFEEFFSARGIVPLTGNLSLFTRIWGYAGQPGMEGELRYEEGSLSGVSVDTLLLAWEYDHIHKDLQLHSSLYSLGQKAAVMAGKLPLNLDFERFVFEGPGPEDPIEFTLETEKLNLSALNDFLNPDQFRDLRGELNGGVFIGGTLEQPEVTGDFYYSGGQVRLVENQVTLRNMQAHARFTPGMIELERFSVQSAGSLHGSGLMYLEGWMPGLLDLRFLAGNFRVFDTSDMVIFAGLDVHVTGSADEPLLSGEVRWERGAFYLDNFGERTIEEIDLEEESLDEAQTPDFFDLLGMQLKFSVDRNTYIINRRDPEIHLDVRGQVDLLKEPGGELKLFGSMNTHSGHVSVFNRRFQLEEGIITFSGDPEDPELQIRTLYRPRQQYEDVQIFYVIGGTLSEPQFEYESEPEMELQDIISYTIFGRPFHALAGWEQTVSGRSDGSMATHIALDILLDRVETLAADRLGIDVIEIENTRKAGGSGTSIKAGKYVSDRLFIAFLQELGGTEAGRQVLVEYMIRRNLEIIITASEDYRSGVDMLWRFDY